MRRTLLRAGLAASLVALLAPAAVRAAAPLAARAPAAGSSLPFRLVERFETFGVPDGLPAWKVHCVLAEGGRVWAGTTKGLALLEGGKFRVIGTEQGLSHNVVSSLALDPATGDLWIGTFRGLNRLSAGRIETFTQTSSGLPNDVVYAVLVAKGSVWAATAAGVGRRDLATGSWALFDQTNTIMHEPWTYAIAESGDRIYVGVWGGGVVEHDPAKGTWKEWRDPDGETEMDLLPDDGIVHDVTSWVAFEEGILWQSSYFGMARYDGTRWKTFLAGKSPLVSNFVNFVGTRGKIAWVCTDKGLATTDGTAWATYHRAPDGAGQLDLTGPGGRESRRMRTFLPNDFVLGISVGADEVWIATSHGLARGVLAPGPAAAPSRASSSSQGHPKGAAR